MVQDDSSPFFTTPHFDGHLSVLLRASRIGEISYDELAEVGQDVPVGIVLYVAVYRAAGGDGEPTIAPWPWLAVVPVATVLLVVATTSVPARVAARASVVDVLRTE